jgi:2-methylcitrate dehydratase PrpD
MSVTEHIVEFIVDSRFGDIPRDVIETAKEFVLDSVGVQLVGAREPVSTILREYVREDNGHPEAGIVGGVFKTSVSQAAFLNGAANHAPELESCGDYAGSNALSVIPVALALGEKLGHSGRKILEAIAVGFEIQGKMGLATTPGSHNKGWCAIAVHGTMGATVTAAKVLDLNAKQTNMAIGIAASQAGGLMRQFGTMTHLLEGGLACRNGILSASLAKMGVTSARNILDGRANFWEVLVGEEGYVPEKIIGSLGNPYYFASPGSSMKKYPCCFFTHRAVDALLQLIKEHNLTYEDVEAVQVGVTPFLKEALVGGPNPSSGDMARFSLEYCLGAALIERDVNVSSFTNEKVLSPELAEARKKISLDVHPEWPSGRSALVTPVTAKLKDGRELTKKVEKLKGTIDLPMDREEQIKRYYGFVSPFLSDSQIDRSVQLMMNLEDLKDIRELMSIVTFGYHS